MAPNKADKYVARALMVSFILPMQLQTLVLFASCIYFVATSIRAKESPFKANYIQAVLLGALYIAYLVAVPFTPAAFQHVSRTLCEYKVSFLALPVALAAISRDKLKTIITELPWFAYAAVLITLAGNFAFVARYLPVRFTGVNHVTYRIFFEDTTGIHPTYISLYLVLAICILIVKGDFVNRKLKYGLFFLSLFLLLPLLAKSPLLALVLILGHVAWQRRGRLAQYKWLLLGTVAMVVASYLFVPFVSQRVNEMAGIGVSVQQNVANNSIHERKMILAVDISALKHYWLTGCGPGRLLYLLKQRYFFYSLYYGRDVNAFDPHNEYFYHWISLGIAGIGLLLLALIMHIARAIHTRQYVYMYLLLSLCLTFFTESLLATQHGLLLYAFFTSLLFFNKSEQGSFKRM